MKDANGFSNIERGKFYGENPVLEKLRADIETGWRQVEEGKVSDFDPEAVKRRGREKLARLRNAKR
jgi:hypothetical protein